PMLALMKSGAFFFKIKPLPSPSEGQASHFRSEGPILDPTGKSRAATRTSSAAIVSGTAAMTGGRVGALLAVLDKYAAARPEANATPMMISRVRFIERAHWPAARLSRRAASSGGRGVSQCGWVNLATSLALSRQATRAHEETSGHAFI